jgi:hypothetical protein
VLVSNSRWLALASTSPQPSPALTAFARTDAPAAPLAVPCRNIRQQQSQFSVAEGPKIIIIAADAPRRPADPGIVQLRRGGQNAREQTLLYFRGHLQLAVQLRFIEPMLPLAPHSARTRASSSRSEKGLLT